MNIYREILDTGDRKFTIPLGPKVVLTRSPIAIAPIHDA